MIKYGLISDIHGDIDALHKALALLDAAGVAKILCAGDLIEHDPVGSEAVVRLIREREIDCVQGNHDKSAEMLLKWVRDHKGNLDILPPHRRVSLESLEFLEGLPLVRHIEVEGVGITVAHGTPWSPYVSLFPSDAPNTFRRAVRESKGDVLIVGHTHYPVTMHVGGMRIINPGAVWQNHPQGRQYGLRTCAILEIPSMQCTLIDIDSSKTSIPPVKKIEI